MENATVSSIDVLLVTVNEVETRAVLETFAVPTGTPAKTVNIGGCVYHDLGCVNGWRVQLVQSEMGTSGLGASLQVVQQAIEAVHPCAVIMVGVAFGTNAEKQAVGQILVSKQVKLYEPQRISTQDKMPLPISRGSKVDAPRNLLNYFRTAQLSWDEKISKVQFGLILSGEKLIDNREYRDDLLKTEPEAIGGEMEAGGLYAACHMAKVDWIVVKAICDWADGNKAERKTENQVLAATNAAGFVLHTLRTVANAFVREWSELERITLRNLQDSCDHIAGYRLPRSKLATELSEQLVTTRFVLLEGFSGAGKSALAARHAANARNGDSRVVFLHAGDVDAQKTQQIFLTHSAEHIFSTMPSAVGLLVVDGVEACRSGEGLRFLSELVRGCHLDTASTKWQVMMTCRSGESARFLAELAKTAGQLLGILKVLEVGELSKEEVLEVVQRFPPLSPLVRQPRVLSVLRNAKILEVVASRLTVASARDALHWVGESSVVEWWWSDVVKRNEHISPRATVLLEFASSLAEAMVAELPAENASGDSGVISELVSERVLLETDGRLRFAHDLYADWVRQRKLLAQGHKLAEFLVLRIETPFWHSAVRLLGVHLLEKNDGGVAWRQTLAMFDEKQTPAVRIRDLLIEAAAFTNDPLANLESIWPDLAANRGQLLERFLTSFQHSGTIADPRILAQVRKTNPQHLTEAAASIRLPYWPLWKPVLQFLNNHIEDVAEFVPLPCAQVAKLWLTFAALVGCSGQPAAALAVRIAQKVAKLELARNHYRLREITETVFEAMLAAATDMPDEVSDLVLKLAGRRRWESHEVPDDPYPSYLGIWEKQTGGIMLREDMVDDPPQAWPDGPTAAPCDDFQKVVLNAVNLVPLIKQRPGVAAEAILGALIAWPKRNIPSPYSSLHGDSYGFDFRHDHPPRYWKTPFLLFLREKPKEGLDCLLKLINFATDRARDVDSNAEFGVWPETHMLIHGKDVVWQGDQRVLYWHRYPLMTVDSVASALMALERWLYEETDAGRSVDETIARLLSESRSLAFVGVLLSLGKRHPELFLGPLKPLLFIREFYLWDEGAEQQYGVNWPSPNESSIEREMAAEWQRMTHRKHTLEGICRNHFVVDDQWRSVLGEVRTAWLARAETFPTESQERLSWLRWAAEFEFSNWSQHEIQGVRIWKFTMPKELQDDVAAEHFERRQSLWGTPIRCRGILEKKARLSDAQLEDLWNHLQQMAGWDETTLVNEDEREVWRLADGICGLIAVLVVVHRDWLDKNPEKLKWCKDTLLEVVSTVPPRQAYSARDAGDYGFDDFAARSIPLLWADTPNSSEIRTEVARLALHVRYKTVELLCATAATVRARLGKAWDDLQCLLLHWSAARLTIDRERGRETKTFDFDVWKREWVDPFIAGTISPPPRSWREFAQPLPSRRREPDQYDRSIDPLWPDVEIDFLLAIHKWIPPLDYANSPDERKAWINVGHELLGAITRTFPKNLKDDENIGEVPGDDDRAMFDFVMKLVLQMRPDENPESLWAPMLSLGPRGQLWVEWFLTSLFYVGLAPEQPAARFQDVWKSMLDYAFASDEWTRSGFWKSHTAWEHLLGLDNFLMSYSWIAGREWLVESVKGYFWRWLETIVNRSEDALPFLQFLQQPAAQAIVLEAIDHLAPVFATAPDRFWKDERDRKKLTAFIGFLWSHHWQRIQKSATALQTFKMLVAQLAAEQEPLALEISTAISNLAN